jgi:hypothetical protein
VTAKFIPTDQVAEITESERDIAFVHEGHDAGDHVCDGCTNVEADACWHERNGKGPMLPKTDMRMVHDRREHECRCVCHDLVHQCEFVQAVARSEGRALYRLASTENNWSVLMPASVYEQFQEMPPHAQQKAMEMMLEHTRRQAAASRDGGKKSS